MNLKASLGKTATVPTISASREKSTALHLPSQSSLPTSLGPSPTEITPAAGKSEAKNSVTRNICAEKKSKPKWLTFLTSRLAWIPANWSFAKWKPVIRCALVAWISLVLYVIPAVEREMGQASILILTVAFLSPPSDPFLMMLEREVLIIFFVCLAWAWASLGIFLANLTRNFRDPNVTFLEAATGQYIEAAPSVIMGVFAFLGSAFFLYIRARKGPGPYFVPTVLACICLDISFTTACIFPYPFYASGRGVVLPLSLHTAICILISLTVFPSTISTLFTTRLVAVLDPLEGMLERNRDLLAVGPYDDDMPAQKFSDNGSRRFTKETQDGITNEGSIPDTQAKSSKSAPPYATTLASARALTRAAEAALAHLAAVGRLLHSDLIYSRFAPSDFDAFHKLCRRLAGRADGLGIYFGLVEAGLSTIAGVSSDGRPVTPGDTISIVGGGIGSGGGGMVVGAEGGKNLRFTPRPANPKHERVDSLPTSLHSTTTCVTGTRTTARLHQPGRGAPGDAHAQIHFATLTHSKSTPGLRSEMVEASHATNAHGGRRSGSATPNITASPHVEDERQKPHFQSNAQTLGDSVPKSDLEADGKAYHAHALHLHHALLPLTHTLRHIPGLKHEHGHRHKHDETSRSFSKKAEWEVGMFESQRYMNLEAARLHDPRANEWTRLTFGLLRESCTPFLELCALGINTTKSWLTNDVRSGRLMYFLGIKYEVEQRRMEARRKEIEEVRDKLQEGLRAFREEERHLVLNPYLRAFEHSITPSPTLTPRGSPSGSPLHPDVSLPQTDSADRTTQSRFQRSGDRDWHSMGETSTMNDDANYVMDEAFAATHDGISQEAWINSEKDSSPETVTDFFVKPASENHEQYGASGDRYGGECERAYNHSTREPTMLGLKDSLEMPPHRYLFHCYVYQYHLIQMGRIIIQMLDEILRLEIERPEPKLWTPVARLFNWTPWCVADSPNAQQIIDDDDDPDVIQGYHQKELDQATGRKAGISTTTVHTEMDSTTWYEPESEHTNLGLPRQRDPDSLPPRNAFEWFFSQVARLIIGLGGGNSLYALKAGVLTVLLCLPNFFRNSAAFAIINRFSWAIFMGQLSLSRFRGDTTFILVVRITSTFLGGIVGMIMWYISTGSGNGNPYGLAATCFVCFPFFFFARLYWPVHQLISIVFFITAVLVIGFSYQDQYVINPGSPGTGYRVFWKRTLLVSAGVFTAFIASFLPPATTIRRYERTLLATTSAEMGTIYCAILSFANTKRKEEIQDIIVSLLALRSKLTRSYSLRTNVGYEFSLRGRWPSERYQAVADLQMALAYSFSHLMSVLEHLEPSWSRAFLRRTRFLDPDFQGDILAVVSMMSNSLRNGTPLPQITPCPLLDRFTYKYHGLDVIHKDSEEDYGLPRNLSIDTLRNEQYLMFCVGISIAYGIINRLDKLMLAVKEIVGEQYHIHGVGLRSH